MQAGGGGGDGAGGGRVDGLVALVVGRGGGGVGRLAGRRMYGGRGTWPMRGRRSAGEAGGLGRRDHSPRSWRARRSNSIGGLVLWPAVVRAVRRSPVRRRAAPRRRTTSPGFGFGGGFGVKEQGLDAAAGRAADEEAGGEDAGVVEDEAVAGVEVVGDVVEGAVFDSPVARCRTRRRLASRGSTGWAAMRSGGRL